MSTAVKASPQSSSIDTHLVGSDVIVSHFTGFITRAMAESRFEQFRAKLGFIREPRWVIDQSRMKGFEPAVLIPGKRWFALFREHGGNEMVLVVTVPGAKMAAASLAFAEKINIHVVPTLDAAYERFDVEHSRTIGVARLTSVPPRSGR